MKNYPTFKILRLYSKNQNFAWELYWDYLKEEEKKLLTDGEKAFQEFDKNINEAIKKNEAVVNEVEKDMDEGLAYP